MGKSKLIKRIENISLGIFVISSILLFIFMSSEAIDETLKNQFLSFFLLELVIMIVYVYAVHWKDRVNADLEEILAVEQPLDPGFLDTAKRIALRQNITTGIIILQIILLLVVTIISIQTNNMRLLILFSYVIAPLFVIVETYELYLDLKMHRTKANVIPEEVQKVKPRVQKKLLIVRYIRNLLLLIYMLIGSYQMSLSLVDEWTIPMYDKYSQTLDMKLGVYVLVFISVIWEWVLKNSDPKEPEAN